MPEVKATILIVDDVVSNLKLLKAILCDKYEIIEALNGQQAITLAQKHKPTLILLDIMMPGMDGFKVCELLKENPETKNIAVMFISAKNSIEDIVKGFEYGAVDYITKPFNKAEVFARVQTHTSLQLTEQNLMESEEKYFTLLSNLKDGIFLWAPKSHLSYSNKAFSQMLGYSKEELFGKSIMEIFHESDLETASRAFFQALEEKNNSRNEYNLRMLKKDGSLVHSTCLPCQVSYSGIPHVLVTVRDMTDRINLERQVSQNQKMEALGHLTSGIAHDFNNILALINGYSELLMLELEPDSPIREKLQIIHDAGKSAVSLTKGLLSFGRKKSMEFKPVNICEEIQCVQSFLSKGLPHNIKLNLQLPAESVPVMADTGMLQQVLVNLCLNARDAMPDGGSLEIELSTQDFSELPDGLPTEMETGKYAVISVKDSGTGIPDEVLDQIFDPFFTTKGEGKGSGLGLAMVHRIIRSHKGWIEIITGIGKGSTFKLFIPQTRETLSEEEELMLASYKHLIKPNLKKIIAVDDDEVQLSMIQYFLEKEGYDITIASNGDDALKIMEESDEDYQLAILDQVMPGKTGAECCRIINKKWPDTKVLMISGAGNVPLIGNALLNKPFAVKDLLMTLDKLAR